MISLFQASKRFFLLMLIIFISFGNQSFGQDSIYARNLLDTLTAPTFWGRGYTRDGMLKASKFIAQEMKQLGLKPISKKGYFQTYSQAINTFDGAMEVIIDGVVLIPGKDFVVAPNSKGIAEQHIVLEQIGPFEFSNEKYNVEVKLVDKIVWRPAETFGKNTIVEVRKGSLRNPPQQISLQIDQQFEPNFQGNNVIGYIPGTHYPDSFVVLTAHYDHLGGMGKEVYFPGASDNASGTAMLLDFAKSYSKQSLPYSLVFIAFGSEESGLVGSRYFVEYPLINLSKIKFLLNLDLMGNGDEGITVVNATNHIKEYQKMVAINDSLNLLKVVNKRDNAPNSDHYFFTQKNVPAFFIYTIGGNGAYHDVEDVANALGLVKYNQVFTLINHFIKSLHH